ncbi:polysaccharide pyruvyl transferase family protein [Halobacterium salinarum]|uniref:polysaccharide pyruvyl transferase family protein n=1 Tax=Halobacterium salinarum TaxID=2242 RepID=UPI00255600B7|nr:polysaccharide pyruvyl transferase family protein [Halobacterium salinarum]MDL0126363.1 polysaccharide pyruvyl transferase family protein [Halobacterium salinarum]
MTDIGVLTFHNNENRGAILQAYGVYRLLTEVFDANVEIVEYRTESKEASRKRSIVANKKPWTIPDRIRDRRVVEEFFEAELPTGEDSIVTDDHELAVYWLRKQGYDGLVTGSDEIWKVTGSEKSGIRSFVSPSRPFPNLYFLDGSIPGVKFSYAASANTTNPDALSAETLETFKRHLEAYDHISVRDRHTKQLLEDIGIKDVTQVPDPTLMIDIPTRNSGSFLEDRGVDLDEPVLGFHAPDVPVFKTICEQYRDRGYQVVATTGSEFADIEMRGVVDPFEYYSLYEHFDMVVTNSLHSSIFSIKHGTPFATIDTSSVYENIESKTYSLLHDFDMLNRHIDAVDGDASEFFEKRDALETEPNETHIKNRIDELQARGHEFLDRVGESL